MSNDKSGNNPDQTLIMPRPGGAKPTPGGGRPATPSVPSSDATQLFPARPTASPPPVSPNTPPVTTGNISASNALKLGPNPLLDAAATALSITNQVRNAHDYTDISALHRYATQTIVDFEARLKREQHDNQTVAFSRYALCSLIDETVLNTPWGSNSFWSTQSLLTTFHRETFGGEHFFAILERCLQAPHEQRYLLELLYVCLSLGFQGKLRIDPQGGQKLDALRDRVYRALMAGVDSVPKQLSPHWQPHADAAKRGLSKLVPLWVVYAFAACVLLGLYLLAQKHIDAEIAPVEAELLSALTPPNKPKTEPVQPPTPETVQPSIAQQWIIQFKDEIDRQILAVEEGGDTIKIKMWESFLSGDTRVKPEFDPILQKVGMALATQAGQILITGHTDNVPIKSAQFPSNWHLSLARATEVSARLQQNPALAGRLIPEGRGDAEPLFENDTPEHRAKNRRVEITLTLSPSEKQP